MPKVFEVSIRRARSAQPREYESTSAEVSLKAELDENENWETAVDGLFEKARASVYRTLNLRLPALANDDEAATTASAPETNTTADVPDGNAAQSSGDDDNTEDLTAKLDKQYSASELKAKLPSMDGAQLIAASKSSYKTVAKQAQDEIDRRSKAPAKTSEADDIPDGDAAPAAPAKNSEADDIPDGDETPAAPAKNSEADDIPDGDTGSAETETEAELTEADVQNVLTDAVQNKGLKVARAKEIIGAFGKSRAGEIDAKDRAAFVAKIKAEIGENDDGLSGLV